MAANFKATWLLTLKKVGHYQNWPFKLCQRSNDSILCINYFFDYSGWYGNWF